MMNLAKSMRVSIAMLAVAAVLLGCGEKWPPGGAAKILDWLSKDSKAPAVLDWAQRAQ